MNLNLPDAAIKKLFEQAFTEWRKRILIAQNKKMPSQEIVQLLKEQNYGEEAADYFFSLLQDLLKSGIGKPIPQGAAAKFPLDSKNDYRCSSVTYETALEEFRKAWLKVQR